LLDQSRLKAGGEHTGGIARLGSIGLETLYTGTRRNLSGPKTRQVYLRMPLVEKFPRQKKVSIVDMKVRNTKRRGVKERKGKQRKKPRRRPHERRDEKNVRFKKQLKEKNAIDSDELKERRKRKERSWRGKGRGRRERLASRPIMNENNGEKQRRLQRLKNEKERREKYQTMRKPPAMPDAEQDVERALLDRTAEVAMLERSFPLY